MRESVIGTDTGKEADICCLYETWRELTLQQTSNQNDSCILCFFLSECPWNANKEDVMILLDKSTRVPPFCPLLYDIWSDSLDMIVAAEQNVKQSFIIKEQ